MAIILNNDGSLRVVGEMKVSWMDKYVPEDVILNEVRFRYILGKTVYSFTMSNNLQSVKSLTPMR